MKLLFLFLINIFIVQNLTASSDNSISTSSGVVTGTQKKNVVIYEDIPYAQPPVGYLRWRAPREITFPAKIFPRENNFCIQRPSNLGGIDSNDFYVGSEDCLYLDITIPKKLSAQKLPVMFWIHGGGNTSGLKDLYDFSSMVSKHNVIVVRINYRLGPFGWFSHPAIQSYQEGDDESSNFGTLDIIMALKWVKKNITNFGGDVENITIFGESAGGHNVYSLLVSKKAKGLFHKAISMSGYTTTITYENAFKPNIKSSTFNYSSSKVIEKLLPKFNLSNFSDNDAHSQIREMLLTISAEDFFSVYAKREPYEELPLTTADGIVIPKVGIKKALSDNAHVNIVPTMAGSNRDEVKLWLASATYFVNLDYSLLGSVLNFPKVKLRNKSSFDAFNYYRSSAWKIRGVDDPLRSLSFAGNETLYAYRYDWDDHRKYVIANFKDLIGAAHATEIPLLTGNMDLVGGYPLSDFIYPPSISKRYTSKNMMRFWTNFAKTGMPGESTNKVVWEPFLANKNFSNYLIIDRKKNLKMVKDDISFKNLISKLNDDQTISDLEKCVILLQIFTTVGNDQYEEYIKNYPKDCNRSNSENF